MVMVLFVCRIIGIVLLVLAAAVAVVLFLPVRYELDLDIDRRRCSFRVNWLFHLIRFRFLFEERVQLVLSVLFFKLDFTDEEQKRKRQERRKRKAAGRAAKKKKQAGSEETEESSGKDRRRVLALIRNAARILSLVGQYDVVDAVWPGLQTFLFRIRPRRLTGRVAFGLEDPSRTGQIVGGLALIPLFYQTDLRIEPDFETGQSYIRGSIYAKGRMRMIHAVIFAVGLIRKKDIRMFIGRLRNKN
ncbi:MAG: DUF2953 domain-containing protein [Lachnospiraceae bacterium]|nr:DUF2953 domain-containing protein [Lachnospiraceae bacterium]